eukprot:TRINITY_DN1861_c0_g1_i1.p2 TRINITY_DN1861_c0_g1~~TRINITY_DN1861_c0_g1_i1.p2  ORF type:complete len:134 (+),score=25.16 TRINITY_DN1861_c0_g1_i1:145-546(+)
MCIRDRYQRRVRGKKSSRIMLSQAAVACFWTLLLPMGAHANSCGDANSCYFVVFRHMHVALLAIYTTGIAALVSLCLSSWRDPAMADTTKESSKGDAIPRRGISPLAVATSSVFAVCCVCVLMALCWEAFEGL